MNKSQTVQLLCGLALAALTGLSFAACGGDDTQTTSPSGGNTSSSSSGGMNEASNGERYAQAVCDLMFTCCDQAGIEERFQQFGDYAGCRIALRSLYEGALEPIGKISETAGRSSFSQANLDACLEKLSGSSCAEFESGGITPCEEIFVPKVPLGGVCESDVDCIDGECSIPMNMSQGTCAAKETPVAAGGDCSGGKECDQGLYCNAGVCALTKDDGQTCADDDECKSGTCVGNNDGMMGSCGKVCDGGGSGPSTRNEGLEPVGGLLIQSQCAKTFECCSGPDELGAVLFPGISNESECLGLFGGFFAVAMASLNSHEVAGNTSIDEAALLECVKQYGDRTCADFSKGIAFECPNAIKGLVANGGSCDENAHCTSGYCDQTAPQGACAELPGLGAACANDCAAGLYCDAGTCAAKKTVGEACSSNDDCADSLCAGPFGMKKCAVICDGI